MTVDQQLYRELKCDLASISGPLFDLAEDLARKQGAFLPFGAVMSSTGEVTLQAAATGSDVAASEKVLHNRGSENRDKTVEFRVDRKGRSLAGPITRARESSTPRLWT